MSNSNRPKKGTPEYEKWREEVARKRAKELLDVESEFLQIGILSGSKESMRDENVDGKPDLKSTSRDKEHNKKN